MDISASTAKRTLTRNVRAWEDYRRVKNIGAGGFGQVFLVDGPLPLTEEQKAAQQDSDFADDIRPPRGLHVAKRIYVDSNDEELVHSAAMEVKVLQVLPHQRSIVSYIDHFLDDEGYLNIIVEYCAAGDLEKLITARKEASRPLSLREVVFVAFQLLAGVRHLHEHKIVHRDLKPANIFLVRADGADTVKADDCVDPAAVRQKLSDAQTALPQLGDTEADALLIKIADFGISRIMRTGSCANTVVGTPFYIPPEICEARPYTSSADMWAVGCIIFELATLDKLFGGENMLAVVRKISMGTVPKMPEEYAPLQPLVEALVKVDGSQRLGAEAALKQFFFPGGCENWDATDLASVAQKFGS